jgi:hypothetical protein
MALAPPALFQAAREFGHDQLVQLVAEILVLHPALDAGIVVDLDHIKVAIRFFDIDTVESVTDQVGGFLGCGCCVYGPFWFAA